MFEFPFPFPINPVLAQVLSILIILIAVASVLIFSVFFVQRWKEHREETEVVKTVEKPESKQDLKAVNFPKKIRIDEQRMKPSSEAKGLLKKIGKELGESKENLTK